MAATIFYQNVRGLRSKLNELRSNTHLVCSDIVCLTETWLNGDIEDAELGFGGFTVYRRDRNYGVLPVNRGGGCLISVSNKLVSQRMWEFETNVNFLEDIWVKISLADDRYLYVCNTYISTPSRIIHPSELNLAYITHFEKLKETSLKLEASACLLIVGDYNCPAISWDPHPSGYMHPSHTMGFGPAHLTEAIHFMNLEQFNGISNSISAYGILDLVLSNIDCFKMSVKRSSFNLVVPDDYHPSLEIDMDIVFTKLIPVFHKRFNFWKADYDSINTDIARIDWSRLNHLNVDQGTDFFYAHLNRIIRLHTPVIKKKFRYPIWYSKPLIIVLKQKLMARIKYKTTKCASDYNIFSHLRRKAKIELDRCYNIYIKDVQSVTPNNIKKFWSYTKSISQTNTYPPALKHGSLTANDSDSICELFNQYFQQSYSQSATRHSTPGRSSISGSSLFSIQSFTAHEVQAALDSIDINKNSGSDGIPNVFLRRTSHILSHPLTILYNRTLSLGVFPSRWKESFITPVFKKGDRSRVDNYRPVAILNAFAKVLERLVHTRLSVHVNNLLSPNQHGFMRNRSTVTNLLGYTNFIAKTLGKGGEVHAIYTDFSKAFDTVDFDILISKLHSFGIRGTILDWFKTYLMHRTSMVAFNGSHSSPFSPSSGVPQGSILGPLLFNMYINDLCTLFDCQFLLYADDLKLFSAVKSLDDCRSVQSNVDRLSNWCDLNGLKLNAAKCFFINFSNKHSPLNHTYLLNNVQITQTKEIKDLGVTFDDKLKFDRHVNIITRQASRNLGFLMRSTKGFNNPKCLKTLYYSLVRSRLEYASVIWNPSLTTFSDRLERLQRRFTRYLNFATSKPYSSYEQRLCYFNMSSLKHRRFSMDMVCLFNIIHNSFDAEFIQHLSFNVPRPSSRASLSFRPAICRNSIGNYTDPFSRLQIHHDQYLGGVDIFDCSRVQLLNFIHELR